MPKSSKVSFDKEILKGLKTISQFIQLDIGVTTKLLQDGEIKGRFINGSWRACKKDLLDWISSGNQPVDKEQSA